MAAYEALLFKCKTCGHSKRGYQVLEKWARKRSRLKWRESPDGEELTYNLELAPLIVQFPKCSNCGNKNATFFVLDTWEEEQRSDGPYEEPLTEAQYMESGEVYTATTQKEYEEAVWMEQMGW